MGSNSEDTVTLELPCNPQYLLVARLTAGGVGHRAELSIEDIEDLKVAIAEACTNVINHAFEDGVKQTDRKIIVRFTHTETEVKVEIEDAGSGFDPERIERDKRTGLEGEGGLGFGLMRELTDVLKIESAPGSGTKITLTKRVAD